MKPVHSPAPLSTAPPAGTGRGEGVLGEHEQVTPVRATPRPAGARLVAMDTVAWPRPTPATSSTELVGPVGRDADHDSQVACAWHGHILPEIAEWPSDEWMLCP